MTLLGTLLIAVAGAVTGSNQQASPREPDVEAPPRDPAVAQPTSVERSKPNARARALFEEGTAAYDAGDYAEAVRSFEQSFALSRAPGLLFNIGQAHRRAGDCARALEAYTEYRRLVPDASNRDLAERYIEEERLCAARTRAALPTAPAPVSAPTSSTVVVRASALTPASSAIGRKPWLAGLVTLSAAGVVVGAVFGVEAARKSDAVSRTFEEGGTWDASSATVDREGRRAANISVAGFVVAGAAALAAVWLLRHR